MQPFGKEERLKSKKSIDALFTDSESFAVFPLRIIYKVLPDTAVPPRLMISVPKKRLKHAVDRNQVRRRVREAYRLHRQPLLKILSDRNITLEFSLLYLDTEVRDYASIENKLSELLVKLINRLSV